MNQQLDRYRRMLRIRRFEENVHALGVEGVVEGATHLSGGQEAIPVGAHEALDARDKVIATYRGHGWAIESGAPINEIMAEICHRSTGTNGGRAGTAMISAPEHGFIGENAIVGAGVPIAAGVAMALRNSGSGGVAIVSIGDGAMNQGATNEGMIWGIGFDLPLVVVCENNGWAEMTPGTKFVRGESLAARASALGYHTAQVDGLDPDAVAAEMKQAVQRARQGEGPTFVECSTARLMAHYNGDVEHYRDSDEVETERQNRDSIRLYRAQLENTGTELFEIERIEAEVSAEIEEAVRFALESPHPKLSSVRDHTLGDEQSLPPESAVRQRNLTYAAAVNEALRSELEARPETLLYGEDIGVAGGVFGVTRRLQKEFGVGRVFDTPIAESGILGSAVGLAMCGYRPIVEIMWSDFMLVALDQLINQAANVRYLSQGKVTAPLVVRTQQGITPGSCSQHVQSLEALLTHIPGLKVGLPATPQDAYSMLRSAVADQDPCILFESRILYDNKTEIVTGGRVDPAKGASLRMDGGDAGIITWGSMLPEALKAADSLSKAGIQVSVLDLRWLSPLDDEAIANLVQACSGRVVIAHEANLTGGFGAEIAARIVEKHGKDLQALRRVGVNDSRVPAAPSLQEVLVPNDESITAAVNLVING